MTDQHTKKKRNAANIALFRAVRSSDVKGVLAAKEAGADLRVVSRGLTAIERAMRDFPRSWDASVVAYLMEMGEAIPELDERDKDHFVRSLVRAGETKALESLLDSCTEEKGRRELVLVIRDLLVNPGTVSPDVLRRVAPLAFCCGRDVEERIWNHATWLHRAAGAASGSGIACLENTLWREEARENIPLLEYMLTLQPRLDTRWFGFTPLHLAAHLGCDASFNALIAAGADVDLPDGNEEVLHSRYGHITPYQWACVEAVRLRNQLQGPMPMLPRPPRRGSL